MAQKQVGQLGFADHFTKDVGRRSGDTLERIAGLVDWLALEKAMGNLYPSRKGERAFPPVVMLKVLLLQVWHGLSDPEMELALDDRMSFRRFTGLGAEERVPDHATIWRFRQRLAEHGLHDALMAAIESQLDAAGLTVKRGTLIDASLSQSAARRPRMDEGKTSAVDPDARFGANNERRRFTFGYKMHVAVDQGSGLVRRALLTSANIQEIDMAKDLVTGDEQAVYADRGYDSKRLHEHLEALGLVNGVMRRGAKHNLQIQAGNNAIAAIRKSVEKVFGTLKQHYGMNRMRYFTGKRNAVRFIISVIGYNLKRMNVICHA